MLDLHSGIHLVVVTQIMVVFDAVIIIIIIILVALILSGGCCCHVSSGVIPTPRTHMVGCFVLLLFNLA